MNANVLIIFGSQVLFALAGLIARSKTKGHAFTISQVLAGWFVAFLLIRLVAALAELFVLTRVDLGQTVALAGVFGLVTANVFGYLFLKETLHPLNYLGIAFAIVAIVLLSRK